MASRVVYKASIERDLRRLDKPAARRILDKIEQDLATNPDRGAPLSGELRGLYRYRVGDYRIVYSKIPEGILILRIGHRKDIYRLA